ncbi:MAG: radical SAM protein [Candidatus Omnitrophota bacterium]
MSNIKDYIFLELTRSICPVCKKTIDAQVRVRDGKVFMFKRCAEHGEFEGLISSDVEYYRHSLAFNKPGQVPAALGSEIKNGCPHDCGLCPDHQQHTCLAVIEITEDCNLSCSGCFAGSSAKNNGQAKNLDLATIDFMLNKYVSYEGSPEVLQISGGEPTLHPDLFKIIELARSKNICHVMLNTNGVRIAQDDDFARAVAKTGVELYLQFDGFDPLIYEKLRGSAAVWGLKQKALDAIARYHIPTTLVTTLEKGVNDSHIGKIVDFAVKNRYIRGITFQPMTYVNGAVKFDPMDRLTLPDVVKAVEIQTKGMFGAKDFIPLPCSYPTCCSLTYALIRGGKVEPITRKVDVSSYLDYLSNRIIMSPAGILKKALEGLWSASASLNAGKILKDFSCVCGINFKPGVLDQLKDQALRIVIKPFMDPYTFDVKRVMKCCIHVIRPDVKMIPFCVYNNLHRGRGIKNEASCS